MALRVSEASDDFIRKLAEEYLRDNATMKSLAKQYGSSPGTISNILFRGVTELILEEKVCVAIARKVVNNTDNIRKTYKRWEHASKIREMAFIQLEIEFFERVIEELSFKIETYDDYFMDDDCAPSKRSLRCDKSRVAYKLECLNNRLKKLKGELYNEQQ